MRSHRGRCRRLARARLISLVRVGVLVRSRRSPRPRHNSNVISIRASAFDARAMFERLLALVLVRVLGRYFPSIDAKSIEFGLSSRVLALRDVVGDPAALTEDLALGCDVTSVFIGSVSISTSPFSRDIVTIALADVKIALSSARAESGGTSRAKRERRRQAVDALARALDRAREETQTHAFDFTSRSSSFADDDKAKAMWVLRRARATVERCEIVLDGVGGVEFERLEFASIARRSSESESERTSERKRAREPVEGDDVEARQSEDGTSTSAETAGKCVDVVGLTIFLCDGSETSEKANENVVVGPRARVRANVRAQKRASEACAAYPSASRFVVDVGVRDDVRARVSAKQLTTFTKFLDDFAMWTKRRAHGERRPRKGDGVLAWWRFAVRATAPRGERYERRALLELKRHRTLLSSYVDYVAENANDDDDDDDAGMCREVPSHLRAYASQLTSADVAALNEIARREREKRRERAYAFDSALPAYKPAHAASEIFGGASDGDIDDERREDERARRDVENLRRAVAANAPGLSSYLYRRGSSVVAGALSYVRFSKSSNVAVSCEPELTIRFPKASVTLRDGAKTKITASAVDIVVTMNDIIPDTDGATSDAVVRVRELTAVDETNRVSEVVLWSRHGCDSAVVVKMNPDACGLPNVIVETHVKVASLGVAVRPHVAEMLASFANAPRTPYANALAASARALNHAAPKCRAGILELAGSSMRPATVVVEIDEPLVVIPAKSTSVVWSTHPTAAATLALGAGKITCAIENGARSRDSAASVEKMIERACAAVRAAASDDDARAALEEVTRHVLESRTFVRVDGAWCGAPACEHPIVSGMNVTVAQKSHALDSDATACEIGDVRAHVTPRSVAALMHCARAFERAISIALTNVASDEWYDGALTKDLDARFTLDKLRLTFETEANKVTYSVSNVNVAISQHAEHWVVATAIGDVYGEQIDRNAKKTCVMRCATGDFVKLRVSSKIAGVVDVGAVDAAATPGMFEMISTFMTHASRDDAVAAKVSAATPEFGASTITAVFEDAWTSFDAFKIPEVIVIELRGAIAPMSLRLLDGPNGNLRNEHGVLVFKSSAIDIRGSHSRVEVTSGRAEIVVERLNATHSLFSLTDFRCEHALDAQEMSLVFTESAVNMNNAILKELLAFWKFIEPTLGSSSPPATEPSSNFGAMPFGLRARLVNPKFAFDDVVVGFDVIAVDCGVNGAFAGEVTAARCYVANERVLSARAVRASALEAVRVDVDTVHALVTAPAVTRALEIMNAALEIMPPSKAAVDIRARAPERTVGLDVPNIEFALNVATVAARDGNEFVFTVKEIVASTVRDRDVVVGMCAIKSITASASSLASKRMLVTLLDVSGDEPTTVRATYAPGVGARGSITADVFLAQGAVELNAPCVLAGAHAVQTIIDACPQRASGDDVSAASDVSTTPALSAEVRAGTWTVNLPWRSEVESQAPIRALRVRFEHSASLRDFVPGGNYSVALVLRSFSLETGYYPSASDECVMFPVAEIVGASMSMDIPSEAHSHMLRRKVPSIVAAVSEVHARANEVSIHLLREVADLIVAQPMTAEALQTLERMPSSSMFDAFDLCATVDVFSACLEHVLIDVAVPVMQAMVSNVRVDVKHSSASDGAEAAARFDVEVDYLHPVKSAWEPIIEPSHLGIKVTLDADLQPLAVSVAIDAGVEFTISPTAYEALLKVSLVCETAKSPIAHLGASPAFGPRTYQMTNTTGFDVSYALSFVRDGRTYDAGRGKLTTGDTRLLRFVKRDDAHATEQRRVIERGVSYWASPIDEDAIVSRAESKESVPHVSLEFQGVEVERAFISLDDNEDEDEETRMCAFGAQLSNGLPTLVVAEIVPCAHKANQSEVLLRSDVAIANGTAHAIVLCFQTSVTLPATIFGPIAPGESVWLPIPLFLARTVQWRTLSPGENFNDIKVDHVEDALDHPTSPFVSPPRRLMHGVEAARGRYNWSAPVILQDLLNDDSAIETSLCSQAIVYGDVLPRPITCAMSVSRHERAKRRQLSFCAPLKFINTLPQQMIVTCRTERSFSSRSRDESIIVAPGATATFRETHPSWAITVSAQVLGYEKCEDLIVPEYTADLLRAERPESGGIYHVNRDAKPSSASKDPSQPVSLRFTFYIDEHARTRTLYCAAPLVVLNSTDCVLVLEDMLFGFELGETSHVTDEEEVYQSYPITAVAPAPLSPMPRLLFDGDADDIESSPASASPFARLARNQSLPVSRGDRSPLAFDSSSPLVQRQASLQLFTGSAPITWVTPTKSPRAPTAATLTRAETQSVKSATILGSSAHWRKSVARRPRVRLRLKSRDVWSAPFRIDISGAPVEVRVPTERGSRAFEHFFVVQSEIASSDVLCNTVKLTIRSKFIVRSEMNEAILMRHDGSERVEYLPPGASVPLRWFHAKQQKKIMFRPEKGVYEWSKPIVIPDCAAAIIKMRHIGEDADSHAQTMAVFLRDNVDGTVDIRLARPTEDDGILGMHSIENHSSTMIWFHQVGRESGKTILAPKESAENLVEEPGLPRALALGYGDVTLGEPIPLDVPRTLSYTVVTPLKACLRVTVKHEGPVCAIVIEDALGVTSPLTERPRLTPSARIKSSRAATLNVSCGWLGVSVLHGHEELMYARVSGVVVKVFTDRSEFKSAVRVRSVRVDHTSAKAKRPIVLAIPERGHDAQDALELHIHGWPQRLNGLPVVRSLKMDIAPAFIDLHEELLQSVPLAIAPCARHAELLLPPSSAERPKMRPTTGTSRSFDDDIRSLTTMYLQELTINDIEVIVSFTSLPFLPTVVRGFAGVDRARLKLRGFHLHQPSLSAADVGSIAAKHFAREGVTAAGSLWAHNSLLGDPKRLWAEVVDAMYEARRGSTTTVIPRVIWALTAAFAHAGETALSQARDIVDGWLDALEEAHASRRKKLRPRRLGLTDVPADEREDVKWYFERALQSFSRAVIDVIDSPLSGMELSGVSGFVQGSFLGVLSALTRLLAAALDGAEVSARRLRVFTTHKPANGEYMRPRRPMPLSYMDPVRPYHIIEALGRDVLAKLESHQRERFVAAASLTWPSHDLCILTGGHVLIANHGISGTELPCARVSIKFSDIVGVIRDGTRVSVYARCPPEPKRAPARPSTFARAYAFAASAFFASADTQTLKPNASSTGAAVSKSVVVRCADADAARWLAGTLSPFVNANAKAAAPSAAQQ